MYEESKPCSTLSSSDDEYTFALSSGIKISPPFVSLKVSGVTCKFLVDSGASVNIVSCDVSQMFDRRLEACDTKMYAFNSSEPLPVLGEFKALVESKSRSVDSEFLVVDGKNLSPWICNGYRPWNTANWKCCVCGKERIPNVPKSFQWP